MNNVILDKSILLVKSFAKSNLTRGYVKLLFLHIYQNTIYTMVPNLQEKRRRFREIFRELVFWCFDLR